MPGPPRRRTADRSIAVDRRRKRPMYARAGIADYWILDLIADRIEIYRDPLPSRSHFRSVTMLGRGDTISPLFAPDIPVEVTMILGRERAEP